MQSTRAENGREVHSLKRIGRPRGITTRVVQEAGARRQSYMRGKYMSVMIFVTQQTALCLMPTPEQ